MSALGQADIGSFIQSLGRRGQVSFVVCSCPMVDIRLIMQFVD